MANGAVPLWHRPCSLVVGHGSFVRKCSLLKATSMFKRIVWTILGTTILGPAKHGLYAVSFLGLVHPDKVQSDG